MGIWSWDVDGDITDQSEQSIDRIGQSEQSKKQSEQSIVDRGEFGG